ncbi:hypothetical protein Tcan_10252 [Toxocara canis]|uniref:Uncharacterized protein n=1 Tax=Toxocara canis TaxID=6265 RepID=A0A0B2UHY9_TOXCA|nr:hypothetical protein Tcan_10252 [Toxocara canis]
MIERKSSIEARLYVTRITETRFVHLTPMKLTGITPSHDAASVGRNFESTFARTGWMTFQTKLNAQTQDTFTFAQLFQPSVAFGIKS